MNKNNIGKKLKKARIEQKLTQKDLAGNFITRNMLSQIENGIANPSIKTIEYLSKALNKPISYFIEPDYDERKLDNKESILEKAYILYDTKEFSKCSSLLINNKLNETNNEGALLYWCCLINMGIEKFLNNNMIDAKNTLLTAYSIEPNIKLLDNALKCKSLLALCRIYLALDEPDKAIDTYDQYLELVNNTLDINDSIFVKCEIFLLTKNYDKCLKFLNEEANLHLRKTFKFNYVMGIILYNEGKYVESIESFENALSYNKEQYTNIVYKYIADCYSKLNQYDKAYNYLNKIYQNNKTQ